MWNHRKRLPIVLPGFTSAVGSVKGSHMLVSPPGDVSVFWEPEDFVTMHAAPRDDVHYVDVTPLPEVDGTSKSSCHGPMLFDLNKT